LAFNAATMLDIARPALDSLDVIHLMMAEPDGVYIPDLIEKVREASVLIGDRPIELEVDGGVSLENAASLIDAGATILVAGRAIWGEKDPVAAISSLQVAASV